MLKHSTFGVAQQRGSWNNFGNTQNLQYSERFEVLKVK